MNEDILFQEQPLVIRPSLAEAFGLNEAIVLQQINYWIGKSNIGTVHKNRRWVRNSLEQWRGNFPFWSTTTIRRILKNLVAYGVVLSTDELNQKGYDQTKWYTIDQHALRTVYDALQKAKQPTETAETVEDAPPPKLGGGRIPDWEGGIPRWEDLYQRLHRDYQSLA